MGHHVGAVFELFRALTQRTLEDTGGMRLHVLRQAILALECPAALIAGRDAAWDVHIETVSAVKFPSTVLTVTPHLCAIMNTISAHCPTVTLSPLVTREVLAILVIVTLSAFHDVQFSCSLRSNSKIPTLFMEDAIL